MYFTVLIFLCALIIILLQARKKNLLTWLGSYIWQRIKGPPKISASGPVDIIFCMVDHFEPIQAGSTKGEERERMRAWLDGYPRFASKHADSNGRPPQHTWFYPGEAYNAVYLHQLAKLCRNGYGEIELHHHHHYETSEGLRNSLLECLKNFSKHGALITNSKGPSRHAYGFIHGNMALDNSRKDDKWCGVNNEIAILKETGCFADFSAPTAPCKSQTKKINSIYYAKDNPDKPKSHNTGVDVAVGNAPNGDLMIIQGPLALNWKKRKFGFLPTIENAEVLHNAPGSPDRVDRWARQHIHIHGKPNWIFLKVSCHGAQNDNFDVILGEKADLMYAHLEKNYRDKDKYRLHYVTAREMYNIAKAAEAGMDGNPFEYRNFLIKQYRYSLSRQGLDKKLEL
jgi:hypothetical protein